MHAPDAFRNKRGIPIMLKAVNRWRPRAYYIKYSWDLALFSSPLLVHLFANFRPPPLLRPPPCPSLRLD